MQKNKNKNYIKTQHKSIYIGKKREIKSEMCNRIKSAKTVYWDLINSNMNKRDVQTVSRFMGSRSHPHRVLSVCVCVCVSRCLWVCVIEADSLQLRVITVGLYLFLSRSLLCQILAVFAVVVYGPFWFRDS